MHLVLPPHDYAALRTRRCTPSRVCCRSCDHFWRLRRSARQPRTRKPEQDLLRPSLATELLQELRPKSCGASKDFPLGHCLTVMDDDPVTCLDQRAEPADLSVSADLQAHQVAGVVDRRRAESAAISRRSHFAEPTTCVCRPFVSFRPRDRLELARGRAHGVFSVTYRNRALLIFT